MPNFVLSRAVVSERFRSNWKSGLAVALVSIPLSISLALAAGATPLMGIITAVWAGIVAAILGGSNYNVIGPTGALSGILATYAIAYGVDKLPTLAVLSGVFILLVYIFRLERYITFIPASVIHGFTLGVAFIIGLNQTNFALGLTGLPAHKEFIANVIESFRHVGQADIATIAIFVVGLLALFVWTKLLPKIPGAIVLAPIGIALGYLTTEGYVQLPLQTLYSKFGALTADLFRVTPMTLDSVNKEMFVAAAAVAVIAILETLISAKIADGMTKSRFDRRGEVLGLSLANIVSGLMGGLPATAALARTALNVKSGATHKTSSGISALLVAGICLVLFPVFNYLPLAIVAAILVHVAIRMVQAEHFKQLYAHDRVSFVLALVVAGITVWFDPIMGILIGAVISLLLFVDRLSCGRSEVTINKMDRLLKRVTSDQMLAEEDHGDILVYRFAGVLNYVNSLSHIELIEKITKPKVVVLGLRNVFFIDIDGLDALEEMIDILEQKSIVVYLSGVNELIAPLVRQHKFYLKKQREQAIFGTSSQALKHYGFRGTLTA